MKSTSGIQEWWDDNEPYDSEEISDLFRAVNVRETVSTYEVEVSGRKTFITGRKSTLKLLSERARLSFLNFIQEYRSNEDADADLDADFRDVVERNS